MKHELWMSNQMFLWGCQNKITLIKMSFTTISIIKVHNKLKLNRFGFSSQIMFVSHIINSLKINVNSFIRNNVESGSRVFTLWVMQLHKLIPAHFTDEPHSSDLRSVFYSNTEDAAASLQKDRLQISDFLNVQHLRPICPLAWEIVAYLLKKMIHVFCPGDFSTAMMATENCLCDTESAC